MTSRGRGRAVVAAVCFALGGTALLTWAFSVFTEDKSKKKPGYAPSSLPQTPESSGSDGALLADGGRDGEDERSPGSILAAEQLAGQGQEGPALVIENKAAVEPTIGDADLHDPSHQTEKPSATNSIQTAERPPEVENEISADFVNFLQNVPALDGKYSSPVGRTPITDAVILEQINAGPDSAAQSTSGPIEQRLSQLDTKITIYEERKPDTHEMVPEADGHSATAGIPLSVSSKSLETAVMYAPSHRPKSKTGRRLLYLYSFLGSHSWPA